MSAITGGCLCGAVRYRFDVEPSLVANCYCRDCQKAPGSAFTPILAIPRHNLELLKGTAARFSVTSASNRRVTRLFCPSCGSPLFTEAEMMPDMVFVKCMTLDDPEAVEPTTNFWTASAARWAPIAEVLHSYAENPPE